MKEKIKEFFEFTWIVLAVLLLWPYLEYEEWKLKKNPPPPPPLDPILIPGVPYDFCGRKLIFLDTLHNRLPPWFTKRFPGVSLWKAAVIEEGGSGGLHDGFLVPQGYRVSRVLPRIYHNLRDKNLIWDLGDVEYKDRERVDPRDWVEEKEDGLYFRGKDLILPDKPLPDDASKVFPDPREYPSLL